MTCWNFLPVERGVTLRGTSKPKHSLKDREESRDRVTPNMVNVSQISASVFSHSRSLKLQWQPRSCSSSDPWQVGSTSQSGPRKNPQNDAAAKAGAIWRTSGVLFTRQLEDPSRYQRVNILNLDKLTALECIINRCSRRPLAKQEVPLTQAR